MKTRRILSVLLIIVVTFVISACNLSPIKKYATKASPNMADGIYHAKFTGDDVIPDGENLYINAEFFNYDRYKKEAFENLKVGDTFNTHDGATTIETKDEVKDPEGNIIEYIINGSIEEGGHAYLYDKDEKVYRESGFDDAYILYSIGKARVKVSKLVQMEDRTTLNGPGDELEEDDIAKFEDILDKTATGDYYANNTYVVIKNKEITNIIIQWVP